MPAQKIVFFMSLISVVEDIKFTSQLCLTFSKSLTKVNYENIYNNQWSLWCFLLENSLLLNIFQLLIESCKFEYLQKALMQFLNIQCYAV